jgi:hypothetical protein
LFEYFDFDARAHGRLRDALQRRSEPIAGYYVRKISRKAVRLEDATLGSETKMGSRLQRLNGWRRLWLVATAAVAVWFVVVWPLQALKYDPLHYDYRRSIEKEFASGQCRTYQTAPIETLREPDYTDSGCWHIYTSRKSENVPDVPYTLEAYDSWHSAWVRRNYLIGLSIGADGTAIASGLVYFLGWLVGWVVTGFRQQQVP